MTQLTQITQLGKLERQAYAASDKQGVDTVEKAKNTGESMLEVRKGSKELHDGAWKQRLELKNVRTEAMELSKEALQSDKDLAEAGKVKVRQQSSFVESEPTALLQVGLQGADPKTDYFQELKAEVTKIVAAHEGLARLFLRSDRQMHYLLKFYDEMSKEAMKVAKEEVKNKVDLWDNKGAVSSEADKEMENFNKYLREMVLFANSNKASVEVVKEGMETSRRWCWCEC